MRLAFGLAVCVLSLAALSPAWAQKSDRLARGKYLVEGIVACGNCHMARGDKGQPLPDKGLSGGMVFDEPPFKAFAANITPDPETGIGKWTDAQLAKAIREGVRPDKRVIGPPMPIAFYRHMSDDDVGAIIAYLRAQPAMHSEVPKGPWGDSVSCNLTPHPTGLKDWTDAEIAKAVRSGIDRKGQALSANGI